MFAKDWSAREKLILTLRRDNADLQIAYNALEKVLLEKDMALSAEEDKTDLIKSLKKEAKEAKKAAERWKSESEKKSNVIVQLEKVIEGLNKDAENNLQAMARLKARTEKERTETVEYLERTKVFLPHQLTHHSYNDLSHE